MVFVYPLCLTIIDNLGRFRFYQTQNYLQLCIVISFIKAAIMKEMLYAVRCLKSNEDMILALAGQFKQLFN